MKKKSQRKPLTISMTAREGDEIYLKSIRAKLNRYAYNQKDPELAVINLNYRNFIKAWLENTGRRAEFPTLTDNNYKDLMRLCDFLEGLGTVNAAIKQTCMGNPASDEKPKPPDGDWSKPMPKTRMMNLLRIDSVDTFNSYAERIGIQHINHKTHRIRLDEMNPADRAKLEKA